MHLNFNVMQGESPTRSEFCSLEQQRKGLPFELTHDSEAYDNWFRAKVQQALEEMSPPVPHEAVKERFAKRRAEAFRKAESKKQ